MSRRRVLAAVLFCWGAACRSAERTQMENGQHALGQGRFKEAIEHYEGAILDAPGSSEAAKALYEIGLIHYLRIRDLPAARATFRKLEREYPRSAAARQARFMLARMFEADLDAPEKALLEYRALLETTEDPKEEKAVRLAIAGCHYARGEMEAARAEFRQVIEGYPHDDATDSASLKLAHIDQRLGRTEDLVKTLERLLKTTQAPDARRTALVGIADALDDLARGEKAKEYLEQARREFPGDLEIKERRERFLERERLEREALPLEASQDVVAEELGKRVQWNRKARKSAETAPQPPPR